MPQLVLCAGWTFTGTWKRYPGTSTSESWWGREAGEGAVQGYYDLTHEVVL